MNKKNLKRMQKKLVGAAIKVSLFDEVKVYFKNDANLTRLWFKTPNPMLGNISPNDMVKIGNVKKLGQWIRTSIAENKRERKYNEK
jgi:hypothetical protein